MELRTYLAIMQRRKLMIGAAVGICTMLAIVGTLLMPPVYIASAKLRIATAGDQKDSYDGLLYAERLMNTFVGIATGTTVQAELARRLGMRDAPAITVEHIPETELIQFSAAGATPQLAQTAALTFGSVLLDTSSTLGIPAASVTLIEAPSAPARPTRPRIELNLALGIILGLMSGVALAFVRDNLDSKLYTVQQIADQTTDTILGAIPLVGRARLLAARFGAPHRPPLRIVGVDDNSPYSEAFRHLRTSIFAQRQHGRTLLITSAEPGEGKSTIVANLACVIAQSGRTVIIVDADMRLPTQQKIFNLPNQVGLSSILNDALPLTAATQPSGSPGLDVITSGPAPSRPAELLAAPQMNEFLQQLARQYEIVLVDTPSILAVTDAAIVAALVSGVILVVGRMQARRETIQNAYHQLGSVHARLIGIVINRVELKASSLYYAQRIQRPGA